MTSVEYRLKAKRAQTGSMKLALAIFCQLESVNSSRAFLVRVFRLSVVLIIHEIAHAWKQSGGERPDKNLAS